MSGLDDRVFLVSDGAADLANQDVKVSFNDKYPGPQTVVQLGFRNDARRFADQHREQIHRLRG